MIYSWGLLAPEDSTWLSSLLCWLSCLLWEFPVVPCGIFIVVQGCVEVFVSCCSGCGC